MAIDVTGYMDDVKFTKVIVSANLLLSLLIKSAKYRLNRCILLYIFFFDSNFYQFFYTSA